jgi:hypothetical protein
MMLFYIFIGAIAVVGVQYLNAKGAQKLAAQLEEGAGEMPPQPQGEPMPDSKVKRMFLSGWRRHALLLICAAVLLIAVPPLLKLANVGDAAAWLSQATASLAMLALTWVGIDRFRRIIMPYLVIEDVGKKAMESAIGAGLLAVAASIIIASMAYTAAHALFR